MGRDPTSLCASTQGVISVELRVLLASTAVGSKAIVPDTDDTNYTAVVALRQCPAQASRHCHPAQPIAAYLVNELFKILSIIIIIKVGTEGR